MDTIFLRDMAKNFGYLQKKIDTSNTNNFISAVSAVVDAGECQQAQMVALVQSWHSDSEFTALVAAVHASLSSVSPALAAEMAGLAVIEKSCPWCSVEVSGSKCCRIERSPWLHLRRS